MLQRQIENVQGLMKLPKPKDSLRGRINMAKSAEYWSKMNGIVFLEREK